MQINRQWLLKERPVGMVGPEHFEYVDEMFLKLVQDSQEAGYIKKDIDAKKLALSVHALLIGIMQMSYGRGDDAEYVKSFKGIIDSFIKPYLV